MLTVKEERQILQDWTNTITDYPRHSTIAQIFAQQVAQNPEKTAIVWQNQEITYQQLERQSTQLAFYLQELGVTTETLVALYLERSPQVIISILAILKAGGAYLPLEISAPSQRIEQILADADIQFLITEQSLSINYQSSTLNYIYLDREVEKLHSYQTWFPPVNETKAENLAYVMYTSGSTGKPKGVCVTHRGVVRLVKNTNYVNLDAHQVILQAAAIAFDASTFEIWGALLNGGKLVLMPQSVPSLEELARAITEYNITTVWLTAGLFHLMVQERLDALKPLQQLLAGGDVLSVRDVQKVLTYLPHCQLINGYGPTENTTFSCCYPIPSTEKLENSIPIGYPIANTQVYILDPHLNPVSFGVEGELYLGGDGLARGYLNRPELTAKAFIENPFSQDVNSRLYKTGDRARWREDGIVEFLGRADYQVKIRGFRIELGEIEFALTKHPQVSNVVVLAREDNQGNKRLIAYVVTQHLQTKLDSENLSQFLAKKLPDYMIPSAFVFLDELPLNANGKVDRQSLPEPLFNLAHQIIQPRNEVERKLTNIWQEILGFQVGINQNFIQVGGNSLQATQIISRIRDVFGIELSVSVLLESQITDDNSIKGAIATLAQLITEKAKSEHFSRAISLQAINHDGDLPLTIYQKRIWLLTQQAEKLPINNLARAFKLEGNLNTKLLQQAFNEILKRHQSLRTIFPLVDGLPVQRILPIVELKISTQEVTINKPQEEKRQITTLVNQEASKYFNLEEDAPIRVKILQLKNHQSILIITLHHIISDGWSWEILFKELSVIYSSLVSNRDFNLPTLDVDYSDFTLWHHQQQQQPERKTCLLKYWQNQLDNASQLLKLPNAHPRPPLQTFTGTVQTFTISQELTAKITALSQKTETTTFMVLIATFFILMHRYSSQDDIVIGSHIANRNYSNLENTIGCFANVLPFRSNIQGNPSFPEFLAQIKKVSLEAYRHIDFPAEKLLSQLQQERDLSYFPWFQIAFILLNVPNSDFQLPSIDITEQRIDKGCAIFDMTVLIEQKGQELQGSIEYNTDIYDHDTVSHLIGHFQVLLEGITTDRQKSVKNYPLLTIAEEKQILQKWNQTKTDYPQHLCVHQLFEQQVQKTPEEIAVVFEEHKITYSQLNHQANQLAYRLQELGVQPEVLVGICIDRSISMIIALLAILKAGGAYVPLDPHYPPERLAYILENAQVSVLLSESSLSAILPANQEKIIILDDEENNLTEKPVENLPASAQLENIAYVIYTSGSTGKPKGVQIEHRNLINLLIAFQNLLQITDKDTWLAITTISFDIAALEIFLPLITGAKLYLVSRETSRDGIALLRAMEKSQATFLQATPTTWQILLLAGWKKTPQLTVLTGGEALPPHLASQLLSKSLRLYNVYGPTETTIWSLAKQIKNDKQPITIGFPIANTQVYILDTQLQPLPVGITGELYIAGDGVTRGYLNRPDLTAEKFIPNPFAQKLPTKSLLYKTGDYARYLPNGEIEFLGRVDNQVKIRGFRIELGEIESALNQHPQIQEAIVMVRKIISNQKQLIAYLVTKPEINLTVEAMRTFLKGKLPEYMIPAGFLFLASFPLTPNGKIDRHALPNPQLTSLQTPETFMAPRDEWEIYLTQMWQKILALKSISIQDNFFTIGGDSLLAVRLFSELGKKLGKNLSLALIFQAPTIEQLAQVLRVQGFSLPESSVLPIKPQGSKPPLFFVNSMSYAKKISRLISPEQPFYCVNIFGNTKFFANKNSQLSLENIAAKFIADMQTIQPQGPYLLVGYCADSFLVFEMAQQLANQGEKVELVAFIDAIWEFEKLTSNFYLKNTQRFGIGYIPYKLQKNLSFRFERLVKNFKKLLRKLSLLPNEDLVREAQDVKLLQDYYQAIDTYQPKFYAGTVNLLISSEMNYFGHSQLSNLVEKLNIQEIPGYHDNLFEKPEIVSNLEKLIN